MKNLYVVYQMAESWGDIYFDEITGVFSSKEEAQKVADKNWGSYVEGPFTLDEVKHDSN